MEVVDVVVGGGGLRTVDVKKRWGTKVLILAKGRRMAPLIKTKVR